MQGRIYTAVLIALAVAAPDATASDRTTRLMENYAERVQPSVGPADVEWRSTWVHRFNRRLYGYGYIGWRKNDWYYCSNTGVVRDEGKARRWPDRIGRYQIVARRVGTIVPDMNWTCYSESDGVIRVGPDGETLAPGETD